MEGGCDWGVSNEFFFSKLGLLLGINVVFIVAARYRIRNWRAFGPHFIVLTALTAWNYSDEYCRNYYSHPNGSIGQMTAELMAFAVLGIAIVTQMRIHRCLHLVLALLSWNVLHVGTFYVGLLFFDHWTWTHTLWIIGVLVTTALIIRMRHRERGTTKPAAA